MTGKQQHKARLFDNCVLSFISTNAAVHNSITLFSCDIVGLPAIGHVAEFQACGSEAIVNCS